MHKYIHIYMSTLLYLYVNLICSCIHEELCCIHIAKLHYSIQFSSSKFNKIYPIQLKCTLIIIRAKQLSLNIKVLSVMDMIGVWVAGTFSHIQSHSVIISNAYKSYFKIRYGCCFERIWLSEYQVKTDIIAGNNIENLNKAEIQILRN